jgi:hypothetical protein
MNTATTPTATPVQQESEASMSARETGLFEIQIADVSVQEQIARLADSIWQQRDCSEGPAQANSKEAESQFCESPSRWRHGRDRLLSLL